MAQTNPNVQFLIRDLGDVRRSCSTLTQDGGITVRQHEIISEIASYIGAKMRELQEASR